MSMVQYQVIPRNSQYDARHSIEIVCLYARNGSTPSLAVSVRVT
jgi:hypothetical protein